MTIGQSFALTAEFWPSSGKNRSYDVYMAKRISKPNFHCSIIGILLLDRIQSEQPWLSNIKTCCRCIYMILHVCSYWKMGNIKQLVVSFHWNRTWKYSVYSTHAPLIPSRILGVLRPVSSSLNLQIWATQKAENGIRCEKKRHEDSQNGIVC